MLMDFTATISSQRSDQSYVYAIQFLDKIYVLNNGEVKASISSEDVAQFLSEELATPSPLTVFNQVLNARMQVVAFQRKQPANSKKGVDELDIVGFASIDYI